jgi:hypothetical protein
VLCFISEQLYSNRIIEKNCITRQMQPTQKTARLICSVISRI